VTRLAYYSFIIFSRAGELAASEDVAASHTIRLNSAESDVEFGIYTDPLSRTIAMSNVQNPTYFLAPNWSFRPGGKIAIGNIIKNPLKPHMVLTRPESTKPPIATDTITERNWRLSVETATSLSLNLWGTFLQIFRLGLSTNHERTKNSNFTMTSLDTITMSEDLPIDELKARCNDQPVKKYMRLDSVYCNPVYMITGIKVAKDFKLEGEKSSTNAIEGEAGGQVSPDVSLGGGAGISKTTRVMDGFEAEGDVIFAYQLIKIKPKGWSKDKDFQTSEYEHRQAFLEGGKSNADQVADEVEGEIEAVERNDFECLFDAQVVDIGGVMVGYEGPKVAE